MVKFAVLTACLLTFMGSVQAASFIRYPFGQIREIEIVSASERTPMENKSQFNCDYFSIDESDVRYAIAHARPVSRRYYNEELVSMGCYGYARVTFKNGDVVGIELEVGGRVYVSPDNGRYSNLTFLYGCAKCGERLIGKAKAREDAKAAPKR